MSLVEAVGLARLSQQWADPGRGWMPVGVVSEGGEECYDVPVGVVCSLPARCEDGEWAVVQGIPLTDTVKVCSAFVFTTSKPQLFLFLVFRRDWGSRWPH